MTKDEIQAALDDCNCWAEDKDILSLTEAVADHWPIIKAALQSALYGAGVPNGWQLVPKEPTGEMIWDGAKENEIYNKTIAECMRDIYKAMLSAAPKPPTTTKTPGEVK